MKTSIVVILLSSGLVLAQAPNPPKVPDSGSAEKAAARARSIEAATKAAESAKSAEKANTAQQASKKAEAATKAASRAQSAQKAAEKANAAQKAASKAEVATKAAAKAESAQKAASRANVAQKAASKADSATKAASKADGAQKAAAAQKAADKAQSATKASEKAVAILPAREPRVPGTPKVASTPQSAPRVRAAVEPPKQPANAALTKKADIPKQPSQSNSQQLIREAARNAKKPDTHNPGGPEPEIPSKSSRGTADDRRNQLTEAIAPSKDQKNPASQFQDLQAGATSQVDSRLNDEKTKMPKFDQGFSDRPKISEADANAVRNSLNPMTGGGSGVTGPLADSAKRDSGVTGIGQQGRGAISDDQTDVAVAAVAAAIAVGNAVPATAPIVKAGGAGFAVGTLLDKLTGGTLSSVGVPKTTETTKLDLMYEAVATRGIQKNTEQPEAKSAVTKLPVVIVEKTKTEYDDNGNPISPETSQAETPPPPADAGRPAENTPPLRFDIVNTSTLAEQLRQAKIGKGGGTIDPTQASGEAEGGSFNTVKGAILANDQKLNLLGQPGKPGVFNESGGSKGVDTSSSSQGVGGIRPAEGDGGMRQGIEENPGDFFGDEIVTDRGLQRRDTSNESDSSSDSTEQNSKVMESQAQEDDNRPTKAPEAEAAETRQRMGVEDLQPAEASPFTVGETRRAIRENVVDSLKSIGVSPDVARQIGTETASPGTAQDGKDRVNTITTAAGDLQLVGVPPEKQRKVVDAISRSKDPAATAEEAVGEAATETTFGKGVAERVPPEKRGNFREVFKNLIDIKGQLENLGGEPDGPEVLEAVQEGARLGVTDPEEKSRILEKAGQKVLDSQGFTPAKDGETVAQRLDRIAVEQKAQLEAMRKAAAAKKKLAGFSTDGLRIRPGAAGSSASGRSVAVEVTTAVGGGTGEASGAGENKAGTGIVSELKAGSGGKNLETRPVDFHLAAGTGGGSNSPGSGTSATAPATNTGPAGPPAAAIDNPIHEVDGTPGSGGNAPGESPAQPTQPPAADKKSPEGTASREGSVAVDEGGVLIGGGGSGMPVGHSHQDSVGGAPGHDVTMRSDGTFTGVVFTEVINADGSKTITSTTVSGTWAPGPDGNPVVTSQTNSSESTTATVPAQGGGGQTASNDNSGGSGGGNSGGQDASGGDDDNDNNDNSDPTLSADEQDAERDRRESENSTETAVATPLHPDFQKDQGTGTRMAEQTSGRVGASEARNALRGVGFAAGGGGAGGPTDNPENASGTGVPLNPQDVKILSKTASSRTVIKTTGGSVDPSPINETSVTITDRDMKELGLRGTGGAKGPTDQPTQPSSPTDPNSPLGGPVPMAPPSPRISVPVKALQGIRVESIEVNAAAVEAATAP